jgi:hypothetical protein
MKRSEFDKEIEVVINMASAAGNDDLYNKAQALSKSAFDQYWSSDDVSDFYVQLLEQMKAELLNDDTTKVVIVKQKEPVVVRRTVVVRREPSSAEIVADSIGALAGAARALFPWL